MQPNKAMSESHQDRFSREQEFLVTSLADLETQYSAGELSGENYDLLKSQYVARIARTIRADDETAATPARSERRWPALALLFLGMALLATVAGIMLATFSGSRGVNDHITGGIRESVRSRLFDAREAMGNQDLDQAIAIYADVLRDQPSNAEALAYRGWLANLTGEIVVARDFVEQAIAVDPNLPDARVFAASLLLAAGEPLAASDQLHALDRIDSPPFIDQLVESQQLDSNVAIAAGEAAATLTAPLLAGATFDATEIPVRYVVAAAEHLAATQQLSEGLNLFKAMLATSADDPEVLVAFAWFLARASGGVDAGVNEARAYLDRLIEADPNNPEALVYRAFVLQKLEEPEAALADLEAYDALGVVRRDLDRLLTNQGLREVLS